MVFFPLDILLVGMVLYPFFPSVLANPPLVGIVFFLLFPRVCAVLPLVG